MKKVRIALTSAACLIAVGSAFAFANPFVATKSYRVDPVAGTPVLPLLEVGSHACLGPTLFCKITYQLDAQGNPTGPGTLSTGSYTPIP